MGTRRLLFLLNGWKCLCTYVNFVSVAKNPVIHGGFKCTETRSSVGDEGDLVHSMRHSSPGIHDWYTAVYILAFWERQKIWGKKIINPSISPQFSLSTYEARVGRTACFNCSKVLRWQERDKPNLVGEKILRFEVGVKIMGQVISRSPWMILDFTSGMVMKVLSFIRRPGGEGYFCSKFRAKLIWAGHLNEWTFITNSKTATKFLTNRGGDPVENETKLLFFSVGQQHSLWTKSAQVHYFRVVSFSFRHP